MKNSIINVLYLDHDLFTKYVNGHFFHDFYAIRVRKNRSHCFLVILANFNQISNYIRDTCDSNPRF